jgi:hypothetical protein
MSTKKLEVGMFVRWEPAERHAKLSFVDMIKWGAVGRVLQLPHNGSALVDFASTNPLEGRGYWCRASDLRVITERDYHIFNAIDALKVGAS